MPDDELADPAPPPARPGDCGRCEHGWKIVGAAYIRRHYEAWGLTEEQIERFRPGTVYPCRECRPGLFYRWVGGHLDPEHNRADCDECSGRQDSTSRRGRRRPAPSAPARRDLE